MTTPPEDVLRLAEERAERRAAGDFAAADRLRERIRAAGFEVTDRPDHSFELRATDSPAPARIRPHRGPWRLTTPVEVSWSLHWLHQGWADDILRGIRSFREVAGGRSLQDVVVEAVPAPEGTWPQDVDIVPLSEDPGFGVSRAMGLARCKGGLVMIVDGSVEAAGDVFGPLERLLADRSVGVAGPLGLTSRDLREFKQAEGPEVDAIEGYLMAFRREVLERGAVFDARYRFYRAADIDLSFQIKALGLRAMRVEVPIRRHDHRAWSEAPRDRREALSKRNFYRFLDRFRGRTDLLVGRE